MYSFIILNNHSGEKRFQFIFYMKNIALAHDNLGAFIYEASEILWSLENFHSLSCCRLPWSDGKIMN